MPRTDQENDTMANFNALADFKTVSQAFLKGTSDGATGISAREQRAIELRYNSLTPEEQREARRFTRDQPELNRVMQNIDPKITY